LADIERDPPNQASAPTRALVSWALYDWANSPFFTLVITFVFSAYFAQAIVGDPIRGTALWGYATITSGLLVAVFSPILGAVADAGGRRKPWLIAFTGICVLASAMLWYAEAAPAFIGWALAWVVVATVGIEFGIVFNNAMLPDLVAAARMGRWSGWAWALGYLGGLAALVLALMGFVVAERPWFGLDKESFQHVRMVGPLVAVWLVAFSWPLFAYTPDRMPSGLAVRAGVVRGMRNLIATLARVRDYGDLARFLVARMLYADGLATVFAFGGIYAAGTFAMTLEQVMVFGIVLNVTAGAGAFAFAWIDDWLGSKRTILIALVGLIASALGAVVVTDPFWFWFWGALLGVFVGPTQAASRTLMARLAPAELRTEFFGLYALTGKATAFAGPFLVATVTAAFESQRLGLSTVLAFFLVGFALMFTVREPERA
jgi:UMF1 family MFS transporter